MVDRGDQHVTERQREEEDPGPSTSAPKPVLLHFQNDILENALENNDGLYVLAPGLGSIQLVASMLKIQDEKRKYDSTGQVGVTLVIGADHAQREALVGELARIHPRKDWFGYESTVSSALVENPAVAVDTQKATEERCDGEDGEDSGDQTKQQQQQQDTILRHVTADLPGAERLRLYESSSCLCVTTRILVVDLLSGRLDPGQVSGIIVLNAHNISESSGEGFVVKLYRTKGGAGFVRAFSEHPVALTSEFAKAEKVLKALYCKNFQLWPRFRTAVQDDFEMAAPELVEVSVCADPAASIIYEAIAELLDASVKELRKHEKLDTTDLSPSQGLTSAFDETIKRQLAPVWHTVPPKIRQLVDDMRTLRSLANYLLKFDAVTFFRYLENLRATDGTKSAWMFHSASHIIFEAAKKRVYQTESHSKGNTITPVLEELPKWKPLLEIVEEIMDEGARDAGRSGEKMPPVVVFCEDEYTCDQLQKVAKPDGAKDYMESVYLQYLASKSGSNKNAGNRKKRKATRRPTDSSLANRLEEKALRKEAKEFAALQNVAGGFGKEKIDKNDSDKQPASMAATSKADRIAEWFEKNLVFVPANASGALKLWTHQPTRIIVYDPDVALIRQIELYTAQQQAQHRHARKGEAGNKDETIDLGEEESPSPISKDEHAIRVYLLRYEPSPELDKFHARLVRERKSFEDLIKSKGSMALNLSNNEKQISFIPVERADNSASANSITRKGGGSKPTTDKVRLVVDMREFMSSLPAVLYAQAYSLVPVTLEVGDYILSPEICVERKTIPDLRGSLLSGRLYHQAEAMCKHYPLAILLIEFDGDKAFALQSAQELGTDIQSGHIMSRLVLLCLHHPRLRLVWSRSLHATADIFRQLKVNYDEPDPAVCAQVGIDETNVHGNTTALELLRRLPGVNDSNYRALCKEAGSIAGLCKLSSATLQGIMGAVAGTRLWEFLHVPQNISD
jgi:DNA excision repair protein ERCC-4